MTQKISIRKYQESDYAQIQRICIATAPEEARQNDAFQALLLTAFCNYYIEQEPHNCFVAADGQEAIGYILCAEDATAWAKTFQDHYIASLSSDQAKMFCQGTMGSPLKFALEYPAHLHIDLLPDYQRMGLGTMLMDALAQHLKEKGVPGLMLCVSRDNVKGRQFYQKYGFQVLDETQETVVMGISLN
ncbi:MAG TPA: GNAT family N-acetyltransferase [Clostridiales bacterium]|nr:GNAT family N-acetyltransferase [Clostridiales bacterium]